MVNNIKTAWIFFPIKNPFTSATAFHLHPGCMARSGWDGLWRAPRWILEGLGGWIRGFGIPKNGTPKFGERWETITSRERATDFTDFGKLGSSTTNNFLGRDMLDLQMGIDIDEGRGRGWWATNFRRHFWSFVFFFGGRKSSTDGKWVVWGPVIWDSRGTPK